MDYQVWTHQDYEGWTKVDCGDLPAVQRAYMEALKAGQEPMVTVEIPVEVNIKIKEDKAGEAKKGKTESDKGAGDKGDGKVRRGDEAAPPGLNKGSGHNSPGDSAGD